MIPKIIHYCWFGGNQLPELAQKCIASWKKFLPDYEIREWNESNYDVRKIPYTAQAYEAKKYAFVSDYARFDVLYEHGGVYFDTDVEVIKPLDDILERGAFFGVEQGQKPLLNAGLGIASPAASHLFREILDSYRNEQFVNADGSCNLKTVVDRVTDIFRLHGFADSFEMQEVAGFAIYPPEYFCPKDVRTGELTITPNTRTIHHYDGSWVAEWRREVQAFSYSYIQKHGNTAWSRIVVSAYHICRAFRNLGLRGGIAYCIERAGK